MTCKICKSVVNPIHRGKILNKYYIQYFQCPSCKFIQTEEPYWLNEAYSEAISVSDTGIIARNTNLSETSSIILSMLCHKDDKFLDYGGGYGIFTRIMRDKGFDFYWYDKYATNLVARGFEQENNYERYGAVTSFENFEHFENPIENLETIFGLTDLVLFSTELTPNTPYPPEKWWYYCLEHGQHISLFSRQSLEFIGEKYGYFLTTNNTNLHIFSKIPISSKIFLLEKIVRKIGLTSFFTYTPKTLRDMDAMIQKMRQL